MKRNRAKPVHRRRRKFKPRKGLTVLSAYDPTYKVVLDKSIQPERLFHEKNTGNPGRWWAKSELRRFVSDDLIPKPLTMITQSLAADRAQLAIGAASSQQLRAPLPPKQQCKGCAIKFRPPDRRPRKFHSVDCERIYAKKKRDAAERPKAESRGDDPRPAITGGAPGARRVLENMHDSHRGVRKVDGAIQTQPGAQQGS